MRPLSKDTGSPGQRTPNSIAEALSRPSHPVTTQRLRDLERRKSRTPSYRRVDGERRRRPTAAAAGICRFRQASHAGYIHPPLGTHLYPHQYMFVVSLQVPISHHISYTLSSFRLSGIQESCVRPGVAGFTTGNELKRKNPKKNPGSAPNNCFSSCAILSRSAKK
jgi:hypothetical protein